MSKFTTPRLLISGLTSQAGKSIITLGLLIALKKRKLNVAVCTSRTSLYNSILYRRITNRYINTLDQNLLTPQQILLQLKNSAKGADILLIDGVGGLYDGDRPTSHKGSDAFLATLTETPVINVIDVSNFSTTFGVVVRGLKGAALTFDYAGTIANKIKEFTLDYNNKDRDFYESTLKLFEGDNLIGALPILIDNHFKSLLSDTQITNPPFYPRKFLFDLGDKIEECLDIDELLKISDKVNTLDIPFMEEVFGRRCRIAIADDNAFGFCFQDNFDLLTQYGAEIVKFSPLIEDSLPKDIGAVYIPGGFLREYARELAENISMKNSIVDFVNNGGGIYSEGAGTAYLCNRFIFDDDGNTEEFEGVGIIEGVAVALNYADYNRPKPLSYELTIEEDSLIGMSGYEIRGVWLYDWDIQATNNIPRIVKSKTESVSKLEGYSPTPQSLCIEGFLNFATIPQIAKNMVDSAELLQNRSFDK